MCFSMVFLYKVYIVGSDNLNTIFLSQGDEYGVNLFLNLIYMLVRAIFGCLMTLNLYIIVFAKNAFKPLYCLFCRLKGILCIAIL